jgi:hypothetical protein
MSVDISFSKTIRLSDIKKSEKLKVGRKQHLYGEKEFDIPTFKISHKDFPKEAVYVRYYQIVKHDGTVYQEMPTYKTKCDDLEFCEVECTISTEYYHITYELNKEFGIEFAYNVDPRDTNPEFHKPMSLEKYEEYHKNLPVKRKRISTKIHQ